MMDKRMVVAVALLMASFAQIGTAGNGFVALQSADPGCPNDSGDVYVSCGNGTVTDNRTGLVWLRNSQCFGTTTWEDANAIVANLSDIPADSVAAGDDCGLSDGSSPGEWRLPTVSEWETMRATAACDPAITNDAGDGCWSFGCVVLGECSFTNLGGWILWSSTSLIESPTSFAWVFDLSTGAVLGSAKDETFYIWPVRGGQ